MAVVWIVLGILLVLLGIAGAILPVLPGLPVSYLGLLLLYFTKSIELTSDFLIYALVFMLLAQLLDYFIPIWSTKRFGGSKWGVWGCVLGMIAGMAFGVPGVVFGPIVGAILGELLAGKQVDKALKAGVGSFVGFLGGIVLKLIVGGYMLFGVLQAVL